MTDEQYMDDFHDPYHDEYPEEEADFTGFCAGVNGEPQETNPYRPGTVGAGVWDDAWVEGSRDPQEVEGDPDNYWNLGLESRGISRGY